MYGFKINSRFKTIVTPQKLNELFENIHDIAFRNTIKFQDYFPDAKAENGIYHYSNTFFDSWHGGWWIGIFYMAYEIFGEVCFRHYAESFSLRFYNLIKNNRIVHREMGFIYLPICVNDILINRNSEAVESIILAARYMTESFNVVGDVETSRGIKSNFSSGKIKSAAAAAVNSLILILAAKLGGNPEFKHIGQAFADNCFKYNIHPDGLCFMNVYLDVKAREVDYSTDDTSPYGIHGRGDYSRPYAWIAFGLALYCGYDGETDKYESFFYKIINTFLKKIDGNLGVMSVANERSRAITDTTSMSIFVCALAELLKKLDNTHCHYRFYFELLDKWFNKMTEYVTKASSGNQGFINYGVLLGGYDLDGGIIKNGPNICGDYFYFEALMHMTEGFESCWNVDKLLK